MCELLQSQKSAKGCSACFETTAAPWKLPKEKNWSVAVPTTSGELEVADNLLGLFTFMLNAT